MRLSEWGRQYGFDRRHTWQLLKDGRLPEGLQVERVGRLWYVLIPDEETPADQTFLYARVSGSDQAADLVRQAERLQRYARKQGWVVDETIMETGSGLNGKRRKLLKALRCPGKTRIVVEHRDRLTRFGFEMVEASLAGRGGEIIVIEDNEVEDGSGS